MNGNSDNHNMATEYTKEVNKACCSNAFLSQESDYKDTFVGFYADIHGNKNTKTQDELYNDFKTMSEINESCPETVNPSYYRSTFFDKLQGVFEIIPNEIYQVRIRSMDFANMTVVRGKTGWIIIDCMSTNKASKFAFELIKKTVEDVDVSAIIITHSHGDHYLGYGGVGTLVTPLYLPALFKEMCFDETIIAGDAMTRRSDYMYGCYINGITHLVTEHESSQTEKRTSFPISKNTTFIKEWCTLEIDGVNIEFLPTPGAEAPSDMVQYIPKYHVLSTADNAMHFQHNLGSLRGTKVRSGKTWSGYLDEILVRYGDDVQYQFGGHDWHLVGKEKITTFLKTKRDLYKYIHDQTLRFANKGYNSTEIAEFLKLPKSLERLNVVVDSKKYVAGFGGPEKTLQLGQTAYTNGEYRWAATVLNHLVFSDKTNTEARLLLAKTYDQLAYQSECGSWSNNYSTAAFELRNLNVKKPLSRAAAFHDLPLFAFADMMSVCINPKKIVEPEMSFKITYTDTKEQIVLIVSNGVVHLRRSGEVDCEITGKKNDVCDVFEKRVALDVAKEKGILVVTQVDNAKTFIDALDINTTYFSFIEPRD
ncbi:hypothetical protein EIN_096220 [Entamoeba invadens IP1]|uniref:Metallo-beta-lactamase domain-containing protein n=1 Tax=Entamoeba invadens IP1 TaxID=370355 RepID=A0A0A1U0F0_ENTIV|nr:hypothetical protein EIN_096220 [Entamoeba invadens IP1]ELP87365.1 hypothetical protein EIN_096220 [Entamoeba invadens IP1]|eukprot:XP_004254136.1 hypothetical protein EIN_096220 [Entamoeba invadens IP1]